MSVGKEFMKNTRYQNLSPSAQESGLPQPPLELPVPEGASLINLPRPDDLKIPEMDLSTAINRRKTLRKYLEMPLTLEELSYLLWSTQGIKEISGSKHTWRTVPSAGARHAFETLLMVNRIESLTPGIYRYIASQHALVEHDLSAGLADALSEACLKQRKIGFSAVTFIWTAVAERMVYRYGQRGYRYLHLDAGHVCQNLYLAAEAIACGMCAIAAFDDEKVNQILGLDGEEQFTIYLASLGKRP